jgi:hypothetical protein
MGFSEKFLIKNNELPAFLGWWTAALRGLKLTDGVENRQKIFSDLGRKHWLK